MKKIFFILVLLLFGCDRDWSYQGSYPPKKWGEISKKYKFCKIGFNQSPIDISGEIVQNFTPIELNFNYKISEIEKFKQKFNLRIKFYGKDFVLRGKKKYWLRAIEFHHPSEHLIESNPHSVEMQIFHKSEDEQWLIVSYFLEINPKNLTQENLNFTPLVNFLNSNKIEDKFNLGNLVNEKNLSFFYDGSFTTPPCTEGVKWYILKNPLYLSKEQLNSIIKKTIFVKTNAREVQKYNPEKF